MKSKVVLEDKEDQKSNKKKIFASRRNRRNDKVNKPEDTLFSKNVVAVSLDKLSQESEVVQNQHVFIGTYFMPGASTISPLINSLKLASMSCFRNVVRMYEMAVIARYINDLRIMPAFSTNCDLDQQSFWRDVGSLSIGVVSTATAHMGFSNPASGITLIQRPFHLNVRAAHQYVVTEIASEEYLPAARETRSSPRRYLVNIGKYLMLTGDIRLIYCLLYKLAELRQLKHAVVDAAVIARIHVVFPNLPANVEVDYNDVINTLYMNVENRERGIMNEIFRITLTTDEARNQSLINNTLSFERGIVLQVRMLVQEWLILSNLSMAFFMVNLLKESPMAIPKRRGRLSSVLLPPYMPNILAGCVYNTIYDCLSCREFYSEQDLRDLGYDSGRVCKVLEDTKVNLLRDLSARF
ncbi:hypothetical protein GJ496_002040 [Pomphorhynchus laevis]|nr:hypothetical protein GJ496_002040 [Pomphorhynchus laevis]